MPFFAFSGAPQPLIANDLRLCHAAGKY